MQQTEMTIKSHISDDKSFNAFISEFPGLDKCEKNDKNIIHGIFHGNIYGIFERK
jgi:hypothetical protein